MKSVPILLTVTLLGISTLSFALNPKPVMCPSVAAIKAAPIFIQKSFATSDGRSFYFATQEDQEYGTNWKPLWHFELSDIEATSPELARQKAKQAMATLTFKEGPYSVGNLGWTCDYFVSSGYYAYALSDAEGSPRHASFHF